MEAQKFQKAIVGMSLDDIKKKQLGSKPHRPPGLSSEIDSWQEFCKR
jgi:hypothetical protein